MRKAAERWPILQRALWALEGALFQLFLWSQRLLPTDTASRCGRRVMAWIGPRQAKTRIFRRNFKLAFPDRSDEEIERLVASAWGNIGALFSEYAHLDRICRTQADERLQVAFEGDLDLYANPHQAVFVSAHMGNWELLAAVASSFGVPVTAVYTPIQNPWLERLLFKCRQPLGCKLVPRDESMRPLMKELASGNSIGFIMDQRVDSGHAIPFFGIDKHTTLVPARLAMRRGCPLIPIRIERLEGAHFRVTLGPEILPDDSLPTNQDKAVEMTARVNRAFEDWIRQRPEDWFCSKRRWSKAAEVEAGVRIPRPPRTTPRRSVSRT